MDNGVLGINPAKVYDETNLQVPLPAALLDYAKNKDGVWQFVQANGAIAQYAAVKIDNDGQAVELTTTVTGTEPTSVGIAQVAAADNEYLWVFRGMGGGAGKGIKVLLAQDCAQDVKLYTTATDGTLDDEGSGTDLIENVVLVATITAAQAAEIFCPGLMSFRG